MSPRSHLRQAARWFAATLAAALATALLVWSGVNSTTAGWYFSRWWYCLRLGGNLARVVCGSPLRGFLRLLLSAPVGTFQLVGVQAWLAMISFMLSCAVVGRVAERARRQARQAERRREDVERLYTLSQEMMLQEDAAGLIRDLPRMIERIFALDGWCFTSVTGTNSIPRPMNCR